MTELGLIDTPRAEALSISRSSQTRNRLPLCQRCHPWAHISLHNLDEPGDEHREEQYTTTYQSVTVGQLAQETQCGVCASVLAAYDARAQHVPNVQSRSAAEIGIEIGGPFYLDSGGHEFYSPGGRPPRLGDQSNPDCIVIRIFLRLIVKALPRPNLENESAVELTTDRQPSQVDEFEASPTLFTVTPQFKLTYSNDDAKTLISFEGWEVPFFDTNLLSNWLRRCEDRHPGKCCGKEIRKEHLPAGFRVIDTFENKVTEPDGSFRYVALSYMWKVGPDNNIKLEKANADILAAPHSLRNVQLPNIISDSITLCRDLGERYLWIDRLCIVQDDEVTKPELINAMDAIYHSASFTIVGALNTRDDVGLPGCAGRPRDSRSPVWSPPYEAEVEQQGVKCGLTADNAIDTTVWNRRGWTFQERLLSKRCIYITHHQALYKCCQEEAMEMLTWTAHSASPFTKEYARDNGDGDLSGVDSDSSKSSKSSRTKLVKLTNMSEGEGVFSRGKYEKKGTQFTMQDGIRLVDYCAWVKDYNSRQLSVAKDAFNAFAGVSNALRSSFNCRMLFGIPERHLAVCLCWDCPGPFSPRGEIHDVPSWSWVSSSSAVTYDCESEILGRDFLHIASLVYFHYQDPDGGFRQLDVEERWLKNVISIHELSKLSELPPLSGKGIPGEWRTNRDWKECPQNPWMSCERRALDADARAAAALFPGSLVFNTTVALLKIGPPSTQDNVEGKSNIADAPLINNNEEHVGTLRTMNCGWIETNCSADGIHKLFEFVIVSGRLQEYYKRKMSAWEERYSDIWELNVIMVERLPCKPFVARRVGIGTVTMCKWKDCSARWETVVLL